MRRQATPPDPAQLDRIFFALADTTRRGMLERLSRAPASVSQLADAYVLVVRQGATSESQVEAALDELQGGETLGVILNRFDSNIPKRLRRLVGT